MVASEIMRANLLPLLLVIAVLSQGVAQASMALMPDSMTETSHCDGHMQGDAACDCCPDGAPTGGGCEAVCGFVALTAIPVWTGVGSASENTRLIVLFPPNPAYLPLNPPPID